MLILAFILISTPGAVFGETIDELNDNNDGSSTRAGIVQSSNDTATGDDGTSSSNEIDTDGNNTFSEGNENQDNNKTDSDGDGYSDAQEGESGSNPNDSRSTPLDLDGDGVSNDNDAYPMDPERWNREVNNKYYIVLLIIGLFLLFAVGYNTYSRINYKNVLDHETRLIVYEYIRTNPGQHIGGLNRNLGINKSTLRHHIRSLLSNEIIKEKRHGKFKVYYPVDFYNCVFLTPVQREIVDVVKSNGGVTTNDIAEKIGKERSTVIYHINNLTDKDILIPEKDDKKVIWHVNMDMLMDFNVRV